MILVTGANGFLGQYTCQRLLEEGYEVRALVRDSKKMDTFPAKALLEIFEADLLDPVRIMDSLEGISTVIHCAALVSFDPSDCRQLMEINVYGTRNLVNACLTHNTDRLIHISSVAALGRTVPNGTVDEEAKWQDSRWNTCYGRSKHESELEVWRGITEGLEAVILNPSVIIGKPVPGAMSNKLFEYVRKNPGYYPTGNLNYVDVRDVCDAIVTLIDSPISGERYILNAESIPYQEFFENAAQKINISPPARPAGNFALSLALWGDRLRSVLSGGKRTFTRDTLRLSKTKIYFSNEKARRELNSTFAPLSESLDWILT